MDIAVLPKMARRQGGTKEHVRHGPVTEEQRSRRAIIGETLRAEAFLSCGFVARRVQVHEGHGPLLAPRHKPKIPTAAMSIVFQQAANAL